MALTKLDETIYVRLLNEGTEVRRPTKGRSLADGVYEILPTLDYDASGEEWEFPPGSRVRMQREHADGADYFIAVQL